MSRATAAEASYVFTTLAAAQKNKASKAKLGTNTVEAASWLIG